MTSQLISKFCTSLGCRSNLLRTGSNINSALNQKIPLFHNQQRLAGHAKWQNIASTKKTNDLAKGQKISRYVQMVRRAVVSGGRQGDPKLNGKLADVLNEAYKANVPKATLERAIARALDVKIASINIEIQGPGQCAVIARCETENQSAFRREVKKAIKKLDSTLMGEDTLINMFQSRGLIRTETKTADGREVNQDFAEEAAIVANAEEVVLEDYDDDSQVWLFSTDAYSLNPCKGELEKFGLKVITHDLELVPYRTIDFGKESYEKMLELITVLREMDQVIDVFHNATPPKEDEQEATA